MRMFPTKYYQLTPENAIVEQSEEEFYQRVAENKALQQVVGFWESEDLGVTVSTVFMGISFSGSPQNLFETLVFGGEQDGCLRKDNTYEEAVAAFKRTVSICISDSDKPF